MVYLKIYSRLIPAANAAAFVAGLAHVASLTYITKSIEIEAIGVVVLTYIITLAAAIPFGIVLLTVVGAFKIGLTVSFVLFLVAAPLAVIAVSTIFFGFEPDTIPLQYGFIVFPSVVAAWYFSVYHDWKQDQRFYSQD